MNGFGFGFSAALGTLLNPFIPEYKAVYDEFSIKPTALYSEAANTFIKTLVDGGVLAKANRLFVISGHNEADSLINWANPSGIKATLEHGSGGTNPKFTKYEGYEGSSTGKSYIDTKFNPTIETGKYSLTSASLILYVNKPASGLTGNILAGWDNNSNYITPNGTDSFWRGSLNALSFTAKTKSIIPQLHAVIRNGNTISRYKDKTSLGNETVNAVSIPNSNLLLLTGSTSNYYDNSEVSMLFCGAGLSESEYFILADAWTTFFYSISANESNYNILSDIDDLYAHESQILIKEIGGINYLFLLYVSNKTENIEWRTTARCRLKIFNLLTLANIRTIDLFYPGLNQGILLPSSKPIIAPRAYFYTDGILRCFAQNTDTLYTRDVNISDVSPENWTAGNIFISQMTMKDASGSNVLANVSSANIQAHLEYTLGESNSLYNGLMPLFRNMDIVKRGDNWFATMEFSGERISVNSNICILLTSTDAGNTWSFGSLVLYTTASRNRIIEPSIFEIGTDLHIIGRSTSDLIWHIKSEDSGATWVQQSNIILDGISPSKPSAVNYNEGSTKNFLAITEGNKLIGASGRTTLWLGNMAADGSLIEKTEILTSSFAHYPSLCYYSSKMYISYTKALKGTSAAGDRDSIVISEIAI